MENAISTGKWESKIAVHKRKFTDRSVSTLFEILKGLKYLFQHMYNWTRTNFFFLF